MIGGVVMGCLDMDSVVTSRVSSPSNQFGSSTDFVNSGSVTKNFSQAFSNEKLVIIISNMAILNLNSANC